MFNTPILDIVIGLIFVFLLYSLLVTSINEAIATSFGLRAKMLKKGIVSGMLSDSTNHNMWEGIVRRMWDKIKRTCRRLFLRVDDLSKTNLGAKFYKHPLIRNYGSSEFYPNPTYIPRTNFSTVVIDVLRHDFENKTEELLKTNTQHTKESMIALSLHDKLLMLFTYYRDHYKAIKDKKDVLIKKEDVVIDKDTLRILLMHLQNSDNDLTSFTQNLEKWFDDTMYRVSGWYKRQAQYILFALGFVVAMAFNVDTIEIASKLSKDKALREQMINTAIAYTKDHPTLPKSVSTPTDSITLQTAQDKWNEVDKLLKNDEKDLRDLIALGWGDYGASKNIDKTRLAYSEDYLKGFAAQIKKNPAMIVSDIREVQRLIVAGLYQQHFYLKVCHILRQSTQPKKFFGLILTAFAISLGAPFWFDLLNKLINLRGSEKNAAAKEPDKAVTVNVHADNKTKD